MPTHESKELNMQEWCTDHPWMTFFIVLTLISALRGWSLISFRSRDREP
jgi:hypothetical protein